MQTFNLDLSAKRVIPLLNVKQRDVGTKIQIKLTDNKKEYAIPDGVTWSVWYSGKSGEGNYTKVGDRNAVEVDGSTATVELIYQMLDNPGEHAMCLVMNGADGTQLGLWNIPYFVEAIPGADSKAATAYYQAFMNAQAKAEEAAGRAQAAAGQIVVDQEFIETKVFSAGQASEIAATAARDAQTAAGAAAQSEQNTKDDADRAAGAADNAEAALARTEEVADSVGSPVSYKPQTLSKKQQAQAMENIGVSTYYHTQREELGAAHEDINTKYIYGLYDALMAQYPGNVQKNEVHNDDCTFTNYEYVISAGEYTNEALYADKYGKDEHIKKPKYLILSGIHGTERNAVLSAYRFIHDVLNGHNIPQSFKEGAIIHIMPVGTPSAIDAFTRENENEVDINRDFDAGMPDKETQAIKNWLSANSDADLYVDLHNNGAVQEIAAILGKSDDDTTDMLKKIALKGVDRIIPFWKETIGFNQVEGAYFADDGTITTALMDLVYSYAANFDPVGCSMLHASNVLGIPSLTVELSVFLGNYSDRNGDTTYPPETLAVGAEALGNILVEFYEQSLSSGVIEDMKEVNSKLDTLLVANSFRIERGTLVLEADFQDGGDNIVTLSVPCPSGAQMFTLQPDADTLTKIKATTKADGIEWMVAAFGQCGRTIGTGANRGLQRRMMAITYLGNEFWMEGDQACTCDNTNGFSFTVNGVKAGTYEWTAYYWDE